MTKSKRGGLRNPPGGRPSKPKNEKFIIRRISLPPDIDEWLNQNIDNRSAFIAILIKKYIQEQS